MTGDTRQHAHELIDRLPEAQISGLEATPELADFYEGMKERWPCRKRYCTRE